MRHKSYSIGIATDNAYILIFYNSNTRRIVEHAADDSSAHIREIVVTDGAPYAAVVNLDTPGIPAQTAPEPDDGNSACKKIIKYIFTP